MRSAIRNPRFWLGLLVSLAALAYAVHGVSWPDLLTALGTANYAWLAPGLAVILAGQAARAIRWRALFGQAPRPDAVHAFQILSLGYMVSAALPFRLGDPLRAWLVETRTHGDGAAAWATILAGRIIDLLAIAVLVAVIVPSQSSRLLAERFGPGPWSDPTRLALLALGLLALAYCGLLVAAAVGPGLVTLVARSSRRLGASPRTAVRLGAAAGRFAEGFAPLRRPATLAQVAVWTLAVWLLGAASNWVFLRAFVPDAPFGTALVVLGTTAVFAILPSSPSYAGVFHSGVVVALASVGGTARSTALAYAIVLHGVTTATLIVVGIACLWAIGLSRRDLGRGLQEAAPTG